jgi:hypothetical protein
MAVPPIERTCVHHGENPSAEKQEIIGEEVVCGWRRMCYVLGIQRGWLVWKS